MKKFILLSIIAFVCFSCQEDITIKKDVLKVDKPIQLNIVDSNYIVFFICDQVSLNKLKQDLINFRRHLDYKENFYVDFYQYQQSFVVVLPSKFDIGKAAFLASWLNYGFSVAKSKINSKDDLFLYTDTNLAKSDFIVATSRDKKLLFKIDIVTASFNNLHSSCYEYNENMASTNIYLRRIPADFKISDASIIESKILLSKEIGIKPFADTTKKDKAIRL